jgi:hypothetical protein
MLMIKATYLSQIFLRQSTWLSVRMMVVISREGTCLHKRGILTSTGSLFYDPFKICISKHSQLHEQLICHCLVALNTIWLETKRRIHSKFVLKTLFLKEWGWFHHVENTFPTQTRQNQYFYK